ncbi:hypothetical protein PInf_016371 [Phytophthora infestans]|nr:hypothetical protein PInf_016371 [Phytophthora infestans]
MEVRALRDIEEGEEITLSYIDIDKERSERQKELRDTKHFDFFTARTKVAKAKQSLNQFKYADVVTQLTDLTKGVEVHGQIIHFHCSHGIAISVARLLSDAYIKLGNVVQAYELRKQLLKALLLVSWRNHLPLALAHFDNAEALRRMLLHPTTPLLENLDRDELQQEMRASYQAFSDICAVCLGKPHPLRHRALAALKF